MSTDAPEEGDACTVGGCAGRLEALTGRDCSCHVSPPCSSCVDTGLRCGTCDATPEEAADG